MQCPHDAEVFQAARPRLEAIAYRLLGSAGDAEDATLGAFLAYLKAAETEEFGLEGGRVGESDSVKLMTVHAAKGLEWPVVIVPGLSRATTRKGNLAPGSVFPATPATNTRWTQNARKLPYPLRGDRADLPGLSPDDVRVEYENRALTISGERRSEHETEEAGYRRIERSFGAFRRTVTLPTGIDPEAITAGFENGVLTVRVPKPESAKPHKVEIAVSSESSK